MRMSVTADRSALSPADSGEPDLFLRTVPRTFVHRSAVSEVLLTGIQETGEDQFRIGAQWPRSHSYYGPVRRRWHDPVLLAETIRQIVLLIAHDAFELPLGYHFLSHSTSYDLDVDGAVLTDRPADVLLDVQCHGIKRRGKLVSAFSVEAQCIRDGRVVGSTRMALSCVSDATYRRLRGDKSDAVPLRVLPEPVVPEIVGRRWEHDVVLGDTGVDRVWTLRADPDHPVLFDHPVDHVPGMAVMEAARQAALATLQRPGGLALACDATFTHYVEFDSACLVTATVEPTGQLGSDKVSVRFDQGGVTAATCGVTVLAD